MLKPSILSRQTVTFGLFAWIVLACVDPCDCKRLRRVALLGWDIRWTCYRRSSARRRASPTMSRPAAAASRFVVCPSGGTRSVSLVILSMGLPMLNFKEVTACRGDGPDHHIGRPAPCVRLLPQRERAGHIDEQPRLPPTARSPNGAARNRTADRARRGPPRRASRYGSVRGPMNTRRPLPNSRSRPPPRCPACKNAATRCYRN